MKQLAGVLLLLLSATASAQEPLFSDTVAGWLEASIEAVVSDGHASAASVAVVRNGDLVLAENFGWADPVSGVPVNDENQFKIGSTTKTFTGLSVSYLVANGHITSVDERANDYLVRYQLPGAWGEEVTIAQLLTHASGLDSPILGITADDQDVVPASADFLARRLPPIVREPGSRIAYANYGMAVIQALVEDVTGKPFDEFLKEVILGPLGMKSSVLGLDRTGGETLVKAGLTRPGDNGRADSYLPLGTNAPFVATSGSMQVTAGDMARYMNGMLGYAPGVITTQMISQQQRPIRSNYPGLSELGLAIFKDTWNGRSIWSHGGLVAGFRSNMVLVPELNLGIYVAFAGGSDMFNAAGGSPSGATDALLRELLGDFQRKSALAEPSDPSTFVGAYWNEVRPHRSPDMILSLMQVSHVTADEAGSLYYNGRQIEEVEKGLFRVVNADSDGLPPRFVALNGFEVLSDAGYERRVSGLGNPQNWQLIIYGALGLCLSGALAVFYRNSLRWPSVISAAGAGLFIGLVVLHLFTPGALFEVFTAEIGWRFQIGTALAWVLPLVAAWCLYSGVSEWRSAGGFRTRIASGHVMAIGAGAMTFAIMLHVLQFG